MELFDNKKRKINFVKIIIGTSDTGMSGIRKPMKTLRVVKSNVNEVTEIIREAIIKKQEEK